LIEQVLKDAGRPMETREIIKALRPTKKYAHGTIAGRLSVMTRDGLTKKMGAGRRVCYELIDATRGKAKA
jgi:repressor of nif and glnA expression